MCGIVGIVYKDAKRKCDKSMLMSMRDTQIHRGPDEDGLFVNNNIGLGHRRLSIIDLNSGHQPMTNENGSIWISYNGEIYNYKFLREELIKSGHIFETNCDTEVILHLYEEKGDKCVNDLNGMFAFAIWDKNKHTLFLARDRMGIKPLYYVQTKEAFLFSSEIKSFFKNDSFRPECNNEAVFEYFMFRDVAGERTLFKDVKRLLPGHTLILKNDHIAITKFWSPFPRGGIKKISYNEAVEKLDYLINDAVKIRMMSDVSLGTFCSGGIDSSLVTAIAAKTVNFPINTFSVGFNEEEYDETSYARMVSQQYGTKHHEIRLNNKEFADYLPKMIWHNDEPLNFANSIHMFAISKLAKNFVTVVLTGEGADELFVGYPRYQIPRLLAVYRQVPEVIRTVLYKGSTIFNDHRIDKLRKNFKYSVNDALLYNTSSIDRDFLLSLVQDKNTDLSFRDEILNIAMSYNVSPLSSVPLLDQHTYLPSILNRQDKMSMATSIEARVPLLDYRIVEFANTLPLSYKVNNMKGKVILKKIASKLLPDEILNRRKSGFGVPLKSWFRSSEGIGELIDSIVNEPILSSIFNAKHLETICSEHKKGVADHSEFLWSTLNFLIWKKEFGV